MIVTNDRRLNTRPMRRVRRIHMLGIGGSGMAGIAEVLINLGYQVSGSDLKASAATQRLAAQGATIFIGHDAEHARGADVVVISTAVKPDNAEYAFAREQRIPIVRRAEMLAELMRFRYGIAIAGTHGKTTTTSLVASVLAEGGLDPTYVIGGKLKSAGANAKLGASDYLVAEADESDASFLHLSPLMAVVTNIDADHLETYGHDFSRLCATFVDFLHRLPFYGLAVMCVDDPVVRQTIGKIGRPAISYGFAEDADLRAVNVRPNGLGTRFEVRARDGFAAEFELNLPGDHNVQNALAAIAIARDLGVQTEAIARALREFEGIGRRCEPHPDLHLGARCVQLVDDYGHHPREIAATLQAMRAAHPQRRLVVVFQPHRYTRTRDLFDDFCAVLAEVDVLLLADVYAAGEAPIEGATSRALARGIRARGQVEPVLLPNGLAEVPELLERIAEDGDVLLTLGAGDVGSLPAKLVAQFGGSS
ncbi:UDP-N-acetylmuramate--L-alanine ligase [Sinimarinibacterium sp. NLF-5-8]|uniref:UDP-N-acetylmuramate--L-alanine ligase n=1 Tax=Sinimarinibacterium sp. NLF-5-8 TaxID=2698684 RepID=UPI00137C1352|nr:UDP-N-acetylmuramate--L-alanine ligase [Sinimarinibacterium sp. NLF-5-8]QHS10261.1 UDP-N-acetylmuramate--L-alanine ligase [Sinimarinibacterium sp. NLF-5-8]